MDEIGATQEPFAIVLTASELALAVASVDLELPESLAIWFAATSPVDDFDSDAGAAIAAEAARSLAVRGHFSGDAESLLVSAKLRVAIELICAPEWSVVAASSAGDSARFDAWISGAGPSSVLAALDESGVRLSVRHDRCYLVEAVALLADYFGLAPDESASRSLPDGPLVDHVGAAAWAERIAHSVSVASPAIPSGVEIAWVQLDGALGRIELVDDVPVVVSASSAELREALLSACAAG